MSDDAAVRSVALGAALRLQILRYKTLTKALDDPSLVVRRRALELAPRLRTDDPADNAADGTARLELVTGIVGLLSPATTDPTISEAAATALGELGEQDGLGRAGPAAIAALERQARRHDDPMCRESAVAALGCLAAGRETVLAATGDVATVRRRAIIALAAFEGLDVDQALERALDDRDWQVRQTAEDLLG